jgi:hypothetical protein
VLWICKPLLILISLRHHSDTAQVVETAHCVCQLRLDRSICEMPIRPHAPAARRGQCVGLEDLAAVRTANEQVYEAQIFCWNDKTNRYRQPRVGGLRGSRQNPKQNMIQIMLFLVLWRG